MQTCGFSSFWEIRYKNTTQRNLLRNWPWNLNMRKDVTKCNLQFPHHILMHSELVSSATHDGNFRGKCFRFRVSLHRQYTALISTWIDRLSVYELFTLRWTTRKRRNSREKERKTEGVDRLVEGTRMRVVGPKSWTFVCFLNGQCNTTIRLI